MKTLLRMFQFISAIFKKKSIPNITKSSGNRAQYYVPKQTKSRGDEYMEVLDDRSVIHQLETYKKWYEEQQEEIERLNREKSILEKALRLVLRYDIGVIDYDELDKANKVVEKYNKELKEGK